MFPLLHVIQAAAQAAQTAAHAGHAAGIGASHGQTHGPDRTYTPRQRWAAVIGSMIAGAAVLLAGLGGLWWMCHVLPSHSYPKPPPPQGNVREQPAIDAVCAAGGEVTLEEDDADKPVVAVSLIEPAGRLLDSDPGLLKQFGKLRRLQVCIPPRAESRLQALASLDALQSLDLSGYALPDGALERLAALAKLQVLNLDECQITDAGLKGVTAFPNLQRLSLKRARVTDAGLVYLKGLAGLQVLDLSDTQLTDAGLESLKGFEPLRLLEVIHTKVTREGLDGLKKARPDLAVWSEEAFVLIRRQVPNRAFHN
jgi:Leucine-rich repeat (LRR) protein